MLAISSPTLHPLLAHVQVVKVFECGVVVKEDIGPLHIGIGCVAMGMALHIVALGICIGSVVMGMSLHDMTLINMNMFSCCINSCLVG